MEEGSVLRFARRFGRAGGGEALAVIDRSNPFYTRYTPFLVDVAKASVVQRRGEMCSDAV